MKKKIIGMAGAGFSSAVLANKLAATGKYTVHIFEERNHIAGNCFTKRDPSTGVMLHEYGPHIFQTSRKDVWDYVNQYGTFGAFTNRVKAQTSRGVFSLPINLLTINQFFKKNFSPREAKAFVENLGDQSITVAANFEEQALKFLGRELYENFFYGYTKKQWGVEPRELPASILQRLPVRFNYDDNYYNALYQGIPMEGYTEIVSKILDHPDIKVSLNSRFQPEYKKEFDHTFYSGPMDAFFNFKLGRLAYRTLVFERFEATGDFQGNAVINYCNEDIPFTRITEHKHFTPWEEHRGSPCFKEFSRLAEPKDIPYYPLRLQHDKTLLRDYMMLAGQEKNISFIGRLGTYRYLDMHVVIGESLDLAAKILETDPDLEPWPTFTKPPL